MITDEQYKFYMAEIDRQMKRGEANISTVELDQLKMMALKCEQYEDEKFPLHAVTVRVEFTIDQIRAFVAKDHQSVAARMVKSLLAYYDAKPKP